MPDAEKIHSSQGERLKQALSAHGRSNMSRAAELIAESKYADGRTERSWRIALTRLIKGDAKRGRSIHVLRSVNSFLRDQVGDEAFEKFFPQSDELRLRADPRTVIETDESLNREAEETTREYFGYLAEAVSQRRQSRIPVKQAKTKENAAFKKAWNMLSRDNAKRSFFSLERYKFARALDTLWRVRAVYTDQATALQATVMCAVEVSYVDVFAKSRDRFSTVLVGQVEEAEGESMSLVEILAKLEKEISRTKVPGAVEKLRETPLYYLMQPGGCASVRFFCGLPYDMYSHKNLSLFNDSHLEITVHKLLKVELARTTRAEQFKVHKVHWFAGHKVT